MRLLRSFEPENIYADDIPFGGLVEATVDNEKHEVNFVLKVSDGRGLAFVAEAAAEGASRSSNLKHT
jgi:hypothetical protein